MSTRSLRRILHLDFNLQRLIHKTGNIARHDEFRFFHRYEAISIAQRLLGYALMHLSFPPKVAQHKHIRKRAFDSVWQAISDALQLLEEAGIDLISPRHGGTSTLPLPLKILQVRIADKNVFYYHSYIDTLALGQKTNLAKHQLSS